MSNQNIYEELMDLTISLARERHVETLMSRVMQAAISLTKAECASILTLDSLANHLHRACINCRGVTSVNQEATRIPIYDDSMMPNLREPTVFSVSTGTVVDVADVANAPGFDFSFLRETDKAIGIASRSLVVVPLTIQNSQTIGVLQLVNIGGSGTVQVKGLAKHLLGPLQSLAAHAAIAIHNAWLIEENRRLIKQLGTQNEELERENDRLEKKAAAKPVKPRGLVGDSPPIEYVYDMISRAAMSSVPILLRGETGTGKEVMANFIHASSERRERSIVAQNCAALPENLLESELFGYMKGAFTGAVANKPGLAHEAHGGTLFLDEVGDMPLGLQAKVLRLLQEGELRRVGATKAEYVDVRVVAATNVNLEEKIERGEFRKDLYYRLNVFPIIVPPLRERPSDIPRFIEHFLKQAVGNSEDVPVISSEAMDTLLRWSYPGNVRELKNILERAVLLADRGQPITNRHLPPELSGFQSPASRKVPGIIPDGDLKDIIGQYEALVIEAKLREANWNQSKAAKNLNVSRRTIIDKLNRYDIRRPDSVPRLDEERVKN